LPPTLVEVVVEPLLTGIPCCSKFVVVVLLETVVFDTVDDAIVTVVVPVVVEVVVGGVQVEHMTGHSSRTEFPTMALLHLPAKDVWHSSGSPLPLQSAVVVVVVAVTVVVDVVVVDVVVVDVVARHSVGSASDW